MDKNTMLGKIVVKIVGLPLEILRVLYDLIEKFSGEEKQIWLKELKKFLRKEKSWTGIVVESILKLISGNDALTVDAVDGKEILSDAKDVFSWIDGDFKNYGADQLGQATDETTVAVYEVAKDSKFAPMFGSLNSDLDALCLTQSQIKNFVKKHRGWLRTDGYGTFFLFKSREQFFVARVYFRSDGSLGVGVDRFERGCLGC